MKPRARASRSRAPTFPIAAACSTTRAARCSIAVRARRRSSAALAARQTSARIQVMAVSPRRARPTNADRAPTRAAIRARVRCVPSARSAIRAGTASRALRIARRVSTTPVAMTAAADRAERVQTPIRIPDRTTTASKIGTAASPAAGSAFPRPRGAIAVPECSARAGFASPRRAARRSPMKDSRRKPASARKPRALFREFAAEPLVAPEEFICSVQFAG
jgi:hypothetical protein